MFDPGDVVTVAFRGATGVKRRPAVVVSTANYHQSHADVILGILTTNLAAASTSSDYHLQDWAAAGLNRPSAFRCYLNTSLAATVTQIGTLSERDWQGVQQCVANAIAT